MSSEHLPNRDHEGTLYLVGALLLIGISVTAIGALCRESTSIQQLIDALRNIGSPDPVEGIRQNAPLHPPFTLASLWLLQAVSLKPYEVIGRIIIPPGLDATKNIH